MNEKLVATLEVQPETKAVDKELERLRSPLGVKMTLEVSDAKASLATLKAEYKKMTDEMKATDAGRHLAMQIEAQSRSVTLLGKQLNNFVRTGDTELSAFAQSFKRLGQDIENGLGSKIDRLGASMKDAFGNAVTGIGSANAGISGILGTIGGAGGIFAGIAVGLGAVGASALALGDKYEQAHISFSTMLGSAEKGSKMLADLSAFAQKTPFELQGIRDSAKQLMAMGIEADRMIPTLKALGDASAATGAPLEQIAYAYGQIKTAGAASL